MIVVLPSSGFYACTVEAHNGLENSKFHNVSHGEILIELQVATARGLYILQIQ